MIHKPFSYKLQPGSGPGSTSTLLVDGEKFDIQRLYRLPTLDTRLVPVSARYRSPSVADTEIENAGLPVRMPNGRTVIVAGMAAEMAASRAR